MNILFSKLPHIFQIKQLIRRYPFKSEYFIHHLLSLLQIILNFVDKKPDERFMEHRQLSCTFVFKEDDIYSRHFSNNILGRLKEMTKKDMKELT